MCVQLCACAYLVYLWRLQITSMAKFLCKYSELAVMLILANMVILSQTTVTSLINWFQKNSHIALGQLISVVHLLVGNWPFGDLRPLLLSWVQHTQDIFLLLGFTKYKNLQSSSVVKRQWVSTLYVNPQFPNLDMSMFRKRGAVCSIWPITNMSKFTGIKAMYFTNKDQAIILDNFIQKQNTWFRLKATQLQLLCSLQKIVDFVNA